MDLIYSFLRAWARAFRFSRNVRMALIDTVSPVFILNFTVTGFATVLREEDDARFLLMG
jgi:hypothetical protein